MAARVLESSLRCLPVPGRVVASLSAAILLTLALAGTASADDSVSLTVTLAGGDVQLQWIGGVPVYEIFRSEDPSLVIGLARKAGETSGGSWLDSPPPAVVQYYKVATGACGAGVTSCDGTCASLASDPSDCGYCDWVCGVDTVLPNVASYSCAGGECVPGTCTAGRVDCNAGAGCETAAPLNTSCATAFSFGTVTDNVADGPVEVIAAGQVSIPGNSRWYRVRAADPPFDDWKLLAKVFNLSAGINVDLYAYRRTAGNTCTSTPAVTPASPGSCNQNISGCGGGQQNSNRCSLNAGTASECISWIETCTGFLENDETEVWIEVRHVSGGCGTFSLKIRNNGSNDAFTCATY